MVLALFDLTGWFRAIEHELLTTLLTELEQIRRCVNASRENESRILPAAPTEPSQHA